MRLGAAALVAALMFLAAVVFQADDERALVEPPQPIELGAAGAGSPDPTTSRSSPTADPSPSWVEHDVEEEDLEDFDDNDDNSGPGSDNSGSGSDDSGPGSDDSDSDDNSGSGSDDSGSDDNSGSGSYDFDGDDR